VSAAAFVVLGLLILAAASFLVFSLVKADPPVPLRAALFLFPLRRLFLRGFFSRFFSPKGFSFRGLSPRARRTAFLAATLAVLAAAWFLLPFGESQAGQEILAQARAGDRSFFDSPDFSGTGAEKLIRRQPGGAYYLACGIEELGMLREAEILLEKTFLLDKDPWRQEAALELFRTSAPREAADPLALARRYRVLYPEDIQGRILTMKALLAGGKYAETLSEADSFFSAPPPAARPAPAGTQAEALLCKALAEIRLGHAASAETLRRLFRSYPASEIHSRAYRQAVMPNPHKFSPEELDFFLAKTRRASREWSSALNGYEKAAQDNAHDPVFLFEYGEILQKAAGWKAGLKELEKLLPKLKEDSLIVCEEYRGRFFRLGGQYEKSAASLKTALDLLGERPGVLPPAPAGEETQRERIVWYLLSSSLRVSPELMLQTLASYLPRTADSEYFSDIFESLASQLVRTEDWEKLTAVYTLLRSSPLKEETARYSFLLASALQAGLYTPPRGTPSPRELLDFAKVNGWPYYKILAGLSRSTPKGAAETQFSLYKNEENRKRTAGNRDLYVKGFVDFRLSGRALRSAWRFHDTLSQETILRVAENESAEGRHGEALRVLQRAVRRPGAASPDRRTLEALYPQAYHEEMSKVLPGTNLPPALFYGLVREESYFDPAAGSWAGAIGLSQLMPATAKDVAEKLKIKEPELTDPLTNLRIGSWYFNAQRERFGEGASALAAYNAGSHRVSRWKKQYAKLPGVLFVEAFPLAETREYVRKVLVSAVHYGYLYHHTPPRETVREIFKDFL
jgi:soluble lytic murein transglycosylase-like protein